MFKKKSKRKLFNQYILNTKKDFVDDFIYLIKNYYTKSKTFKKSPIYMINDKKHTLNLHLWASMPKNFLSYYLINLHIPDENKIKIVEEFFKNSSLLYRFSQNQSQMIDFIPLFKNKDNYTLLHEKLSSLQLTTSYQLDFLNKIIDFTTNEHSIDNLNIKIELLSRVGEAKPNPLIEEEYNDFFSTTLLTTLKSLTKSSYTSYTASEQDYENLKSKLELLLFSPHIKDKKTINWRKLSNSNPEFTKHALHLECLFNTNKKEKYIEVIEKNPILYFKSVNAEERSFLTFLLSKTEDIEFKVSKNMFPFLAADTFRKKILNILFLEHKKLVDSLNFNLFDYLYSLNMVSRHQKYLKLFYSQNFNEKDIDFLTSNPVPDFSKSLKPNQEKYDYFKALLSNVSLMEYLYQKQQSIYHYIFNEIKELQAKNHDIDINTISSINNIDVFNAMDDDFKKEHLKELFNLKEDYIPDVDEIDIEVYKKSIEEYYDISAQEPLSKQFLYNIDFQYDIEKDLLIQIEKDIKIILKYPEINFC